MKKILKFLSKLFSIFTYKGCEHYKNKNKNICYGVVGGDWYTDYLSEKCIGCPKHKLVNLYDVDLGEFLEKNE